MKGQRYRYRHRVRGGGWVEDVRQLTKNGLVSLKRHAVNGVSTYVPMAVTYAKNLKNKAIDQVASKVQNAVQNAAQNAVESGAQKLKQVTGGALSREARLKAIRDAMNSRSSRGGSLKYVV